MTLADRKTKLTTDLDHARTQANAWAQTVIGLTAQLALVEELLSNEQSPDQADTIPVTPN